MVEGGDDTPPSVVPKREPARLRAVRTVGAVRYVLPFRQGIGAGAGRGRRSRLLGREAARGRSGPQGARGRGERGPQPGARLPAGQHHVRSHRGARADATTASRIVLFDAFVTNVDRSARNANLLPWHERLWLIDHGASLYFQHGWGPNVELVRQHLEAFRRVCEGGPGTGPIGLLPLRERWHWLVAPRSTIIQTSAPHSGLCDAPASAMERLLAGDVRVRSGAVPSSPRRRSHSKRRLTYE